MPDVMLKDHIATADPASPTEGDLHSSLDECRRRAHPALAAMTMDELRELVREIESHAAV